MFFFRVYLPTWHTRSIGLGTFFIQAGLKESDARYPSVAKDDFARCLESEVDWAHAVILQPLAHSMRWRHYWYIVCGECIRITDAREH